MRAKARSVSANCSSPYQVVDRSRVYYALRSEVNDTMQYAAMVDLIEKARLAGVRETEWVRDQLTNAFESWINRQDLSEITEEEEETLRRAFETGFANYYTA